MLRATKLRKHQKIDKHKGFPYKASYFLSDVYFILLFITSTVLLLRYENANSGWNEQEMNEIYIFEHF